jgi:hypothetical protein
MLDVGGMRASVLERASPLALGWKEFKPNARSPLPADKELQNHFLPA